MISRCCLRRFHGRDRKRGHGSEFAADFRLEPEPVLSGFGGAVLGRELPFEHRRVDRNPPVGPITRRPSMLEARPRPSSRPRRARSVRSPMRNQPDAFMKKSG